ncbi:alpha-(1,3)-fucosyltransferase C-like [Centruroides sculpturatus]|uniref:alpha-(1,3)-fucosyltransferase C-like n=1 Tax=Centruroides sculpturatus TaxID=218467 RepID=UPI000C6EBDF0|nr:alpha-(1,3)-fucosyltransferase C-like [Centruroides sculpturatus]
MITRWTRYFAVCCACCVLTLPCWLYYLTKEDSRAHPDPEDTKIVLLWTPFFGKVNYLNFSAEYPCRETRCLFTSDRSLLNRSHALVFHSADITDFPVRPRPEQVWVWHTLEAPPNTGSLRDFDGLFNWTATYRLDSDVPAPYGWFRRLRPDEPAPSLRDYWRGKSAPAVWFVSNCLTYSNREGYVRELRRSLPVDVVGFCGNLSCSPKMADACYREASRTYFFYLAFENAHCKDYVTEKFFHALRYDMVPVVFGGANYSAFLPPGAYVDASLFPRPDTLALFLRKVAANRTLYNSYFLWRRNYTSGGYHWSCELCRKLHSDPPTAASVYSRLEDWWIEGGRCRKWRDGVLTSP